MSISIETEINSSINYAVNIDSEPIVDTVEIKGCSDRRIILRINGVPEFVHEYRQEIIPDSEDFIFKGIELNINKEFWANQMTEASKAVLNFEIFDMDSPNEILYTKQESVHLQPYMHWDNNKHESLACFVTPNDEAVAKVLCRAAELANADGKTMSGYQSENVYEQVDYIYRAICEEEIHYFCPAASFEESGQKIRIPSMVLYKQNKQATCLDLAVLFASCLEAASINSLIFIVKGHAFAGFLLEAKGFVNSECTNFQSVFDNLGIQFSDGRLIDIEDGIIVPVECTVMTDGKSATFNEAVATGIANLETKKFEYMLNIPGCRSEGFEPVFTYNGSNFDSQEKSEINADTDPEIKLNTNKEDAEKSNTEEIDPDFMISDRKLSKLELLRRQAMDFSLSNRLISLNDLDSYINLNFLADTCFAGDFDGLELYKYVIENSEKELVNKKLYSLYKTNEREKKETGNSVLYAAINSLMWPFKESAEKIKSPLYLVPVEIHCNVKGEYFFDVCMDKAVVNPALKELLYTDYAIDLSVAKDNPEKDYTSQIQLLKKIIGEKEGWEIVENEIVIGAFSIPKRAIYDGLLNPSLKEHDIVQGILEGKMSWDNSVKDDDTEDVEKYLYAFSADSTQRKVVSSISKKRAQVVFGPAGNGKSQTISNILTERMNLAKPVLFIAEKQAAQEVIYEKLKECGLEKFCLYLSENNYSLSAFKEQVENTLKFVSSYKTQKCNEKDIEEFNDKISKLLTVESEFSKPDENGKNIYDLILDRSCYDKELSNIECSGCEDEIVKDESIELLEKLSKILSDEKSPIIFDAKNMNGLDTDEDNRKAILQAIENALARRNALVEKSEKYLSDLGIKVPDASNEYKYNQLVEFIKYLEKCPYVGPELSPVAEEDFSQIEALAKDVASRKIGTEKYEQSADELWSILNSKGEKQGSDDSLNAGSYYKPDMIRAMSTGYTKHEIDMIKAASRFGNYEKAVLGLTKNESVEVQKQIVRLLRELGKDSESSIHATIKDFTNEKLAVDNEWEKAEKLSIARNPERKDVALLFGEWIILNGKNDIVKDYLQIRAEAEKNGIISALDNIEKQITAGNLMPENIVASIKGNVLDKEINNRLCEAQIEFKDDSDFEKWLSSISDLENKAREALRVKILNNIVSNMPNLAEGIENDSEMGVIQKLIRSAGQNSSARTLFDNAGAMLQKLYPCMIMSPNVAAMYLTDNVPSFDLVIFDEGSQLPTYKALIPVSKANKCIIVGDEKQLTPTTFFVKETLDENGASINRESILEDGIITSMPQLMLKYHYRSKYEGLVAFSNSRYYGNELITTPNIDVNYNGINCIYVEDGVYDRGLERNNKKEADKVIEIVKTLLDDGEKSIGVITFNIEQKKLIESMISSEMLTDEAYNEKLSDCVDVVNLEACQGKEWDITILSTTFGKDADGLFTNNLGPMTKDEGKNRLNVMITRAKKGMYVVTSIMPGMIGKDQTSGIGDLRDYLLFADGKLNINVNKSEEACAINPIAESLKKELTLEGFDVDFNVGSSLCKIDVAVKAGEKSGQVYSLGIILDDFEGEFDGYDYSVLIPRLMKNAGWKLYRLHTLNWYKDRDKEINNIKSMLK